MSTPSTAEVLRAHAAYLEAEERIAQMRDIWAAQRAKYEAAWDEAFEGALQDSGLTACSYCDRIVLASATREAWELYSKSDNYGPDLPHTATRHQACAACAKRLATPREATKFGAMFERDGRRLSDKAIDALIPLLGLSPKEPWEAGA